MSVHTEELAAQVRWYATGSANTQLENAAKIIDLSPNLPEEKKKSTISAAMISESVCRASDARRAAMLPARADHRSTHLDRAIIIGHPVQQVPLLEPQLPIRTSYPPFASAGKLMPSPYLSLHTIWDVL